ncbi:MAG: formate dehydrogenase accessory sulfurtransferase FdhD [Acidobacteriaceae bacterium]
MTIKTPLSQTLHYLGGKWETREMGAIAESPVTLSVNGHPWLTFMCTPTDLEALAVGFLYNEGVIDSQEEIKLVETCPAGDNIDVWLKKTAEPPQEWRRTSGCTGGATTVQLEQVLPNQIDSFLLAPQAIQSLVKALLEAQVIYREVGGVHTSILTDGEGVLIAAEDVGRHNTLDKIAGRVILENIQPRWKILVTTGRVSSEMVQKAARIGAFAVISRTAASSLAISLAEEWGITLIGYARGEQFVIYSHPERVKP